MKQKEYFIDCPRDLRFLYNGSTFTFQNMDIPQAFYPIIGVIAEDCNYNLRSVSFMRGVLDIIGFHRGRKSYCRIQFSWGPENNIVVQNVNLIHQRNGYMTQIYESLKHIKRTYRTGGIIIQSVLTDAGKSWCEKKHLVPDGQGNYISAH